LRDSEKTRAEILEAAFEVVYKRGFRASSVAEIIDKTGVTQGAFFYHFPTKNLLGYALADEVLKDLILERWIRPLSAYRNPLQGMATRFRRLMEATSDEELALGCPLNNLTQEMSPIDPLFRDKLRALLVLWIDETERYLRKGQAGGYVRPDVDVKQAAEFIVMAEEGSAAIMKSLRDRKAYWSLYEMFRRFLESLSTNPREFGPRSRVRPLVVN